MNNLGYKKKLEEKYKILNMIGGGGMSTIYLAINKANKTKCAIKFMNSNLMDENNIKRFAQEIRIHKKINSPYVIKLLDYCFDRENREFWIVMELIEGTILKNVIERVGSLSKEEVVNYSKQIVLGLKEIHNAGIYHRDIKDSNIMVSTLNEIKIIDLGIAIDNESERLTQENKVIGSVHYMPGEIADYKEKGSEKIDIYSVGIVMYQMLIGSVPFTGYSHVKIISKHKYNPVPKIQVLKQTTSHGLINIINRCLAKNPDNRYRDMSELYRDLSTCLRPDRLAEKIIDYNKPEKKTFLDFWTGKMGNFILYTSLVIVLILLIIVIILLLIE
ncbi:serine/threonine-protein kinase [Mesomycoplasma molare]|uniref:Serine/threonine protein kinase n=1 Tax=Mesomycoplasma molare TaxID=171288 RepID=A0ABY5TW83_9BACT|nr:serine/threonine-protein kinase [Mesomycoplasma molare]UWD34465.1 serine/threonine protein kinase [Mesomycoplasma molare]